MAENYKRLGILLNMKQVVHASLRTLHALYVSLLLATAVLCVVLFAAPGAAAQVTPSTPVFGPQTYTRTTGAPNQYTTTFNAPAWIISPYDLHIVNGDSSGSDRISSATITLNGVQVAGPSDFNQNVATIDKTVTLQSTNTLEVSLASKPGSYLTINVFGTNGDHTSPSLTIVTPAAGGFISTATPTFEVTYTDPVGAGEPAASGVNTSTFTATLDGVDRTSLFTTRTGDASWTIPANMALATGVHTLSVSVKDNAGNQGAATSQFTVDLGAPQIQIQQPVLGAYLNTLTPTITIRYSDSFGVNTSSLKVTANGADITSQFTKTASSATATVTSGTLPQGANQIVATIQNLAGTQSSASVSFNVDVTPPTIAFSHPPANSYHGSTSVDILVQYSDDQAINPSSLQISVDGVPLSATTGPASATATATAANGAHVLTATIKDLAGNVGTAQETFYVDTAIPTVHVSQPAPGAILNTHLPQVSIDYSDIVGVDTSTLVVLINGVNATSLFTLGPAGAVAQLTGAYLLPDGQNTITAQIANLAGTVGTATSTFLVDTTPPTIVIQAPPAITNSSAPVVTIAYSDATSGVNPATLVVTLDGVDVSALFASGAASATGVLQVIPELADGSHRLVATIQDRAGNQSQPAVQIFVVDTTPPVVTISSPANNSFINNPTPAIAIQYTDGTGTGVNLNSIHAFLQQGVNPAVDITSDFQIGAQQATGTIPAATSLADDTYILSAVAGDLAGNQGTATSTFVVDTVPPTGTIVAPAVNAILGTSTVGVSIQYQDDRSGVDTSKLILTVDGVNVTSVLTLTPTSATGTLPVLPDGLHTIQLTVFDRSGNSSGVISQTFTTDTIPPTVTASVLPAPNAAGWNDTNVTVTFTCNDSISGVSSCTSPVAITTEGANQSVCGLGVDGAGNTSLPVCATVNLDKTPPVVTYTVSPTPNSSGINTTVPVTITFTCSDALSGVALCPSPITITTLGLTQTYTGTATDVAGNSASASVRIQTVAPTAPSIIATVSPAPNSKGWNNTNPTVSFTCAAGTYAVASCSAPVTVTTEAANQSICGTVVDTTGLSTSACAVVNLDKTPPTISASISPAASSSTGWYNTPVTVTFNCADTLSGVAACSLPQLLSTDGANQAVSGTATDLAGNTSTTQVTLNIEQAVPAIQLFTSPAQLAPGQSGTATVTATDEIGITSVAFQLNGTTVATLLAPPYTANVTAPTTANPGDTLTLTVVVTNTAGNTSGSARGIQVVLAGVVTGQVLSDATGLPFTGATVQTIGATGQDTSDASGKYSIPSNSSHLFLSVSAAANTTTGTPNMVTVEREVFLQTGVGTVPVDVRLTPIASATSITTSGGSLTGGPVTITVLPGAVASATNFYLTLFTQQGLPGLLPLGWSPVTAFDLRSDTSTAASFTSAISSLSSTVTMHLVQYDYTTHAWLMVTPNVGAVNGTLTIPIPSVGDFALVVPDAGNSAIVIPSPGQPLAGVTTVALPAGSTATGSLNPPSVPPSGGTAMATLAVNSSVPLPSGTVIQANVQETYTLASGKQLSDALRTEDILFYQFLAPSGAAAAANFPVTPSQTFLAEQLSSGDVHLDILSGRESVRGQVGGYDAATVTGGDATLSVAASSLPQDTAIAVAPEAVSGFLPTTATLIALAEYNIDFSGQILQTPAQLTVAAGAALPGDNILLAQIQRNNGVPYLVVVSLAQVSGTTLVTQAGPGLSGITQGGDYIFYKVTSPIGYVSGTISASSGPVPGMVQTDGLPFVAFSGSSGLYVIPALAGTVNLTASVPNTALAGTASTQVTAGQTASVNLAVAGQVESATITPPNGAVGIPLTAEIDITAPDAINTITVTATSVTLTQSGQSSSTPIPVRFDYSLGGTRLAVFPQSALQPSTTYTLAANGIADLVGELISVPTTTFTTQAVTPPSFNTSALVFAMPDQNGNVAISAPANSFPPGSTVLIVDQSSGVVLSLTVANDGSVTGTMPATIYDILAITITAPDKTTASFTLSQFVAADGTTAIGPGGGTVTGPGNTGIIIPAGALNKGTTFKLALLDQTAFPVLPSWPGANFGSGMQITAPGMPSFNKEAKLAFPVPANAPAGAFYYVYRRLVDTNGNVLFETIDHAFIQGTGANAQIVTASPPFCGYMNSYGNFLAAANNGFQPTQAAVTFTFSMWDIDPNQAGVSSQGLIAGNVYQNDASGNPGPLLDGGVASIWLTNNPQYVTTSTGACGTYSLFDPQLGGGSRSVTASAFVPTYNPATGTTTTQTQTIVDTADEVNGLQPDDSLFSVNAGLEAQYRDIGRLNFTFSPPTPPPPAPQINIGIYTLDSNNNRVPISGVVQTGTALTIAFNSPLSVTGATINGASFSSIVADTPPLNPVPGFNYTRFNDLYPAGDPGVYTLVVSALDPLNPGNPVTVSRNFLVVAAGGGNALPTTGVAPTVISVVPPPNAQGVEISTFPEITFSEPVTNVPGNVMLQGSPAGDSPAFLLIGIKDDGSVANPVQVTDHITSLTLQPIAGLQFAETYTLTLTNAILGLGTDQNGNQIPLANYSTQFTTFGPQLLGGTTTQYQVLTRPVLLGQRAYAGEYINSVISGLGMFDISNPAMPKDLGAPLNFYGRAVDIAGQVSSPVQRCAMDPPVPGCSAFPGGSLVAISATATQDVALPGNVWLYDVSGQSQTPPTPPYRVGAVSVTTSATQAGIALRLAMKDNFLYASTLYQGLQVIDLQQAATEYQNTDPNTFAGAVTTEGQGFATDSVVNDIQLPVATGGTATMFGLQADDFAVTGGTGNTATQTLLAATGQLPLVVADPALSGSTAVLYPPISNSSLSQAPLQMLTHLLNPDGSANTIVSQLVLGRAVALATISAPGGGLVSGNLHVAVVVGTGQTGTATTLASAPMVPVLAVVDLSGAYTPGAVVTCDPTAFTGSPNCPKLIGFLALSATPTDVTLNGNIALVATGSNILLVNLEDPTNPVSGGQITGSFGNWLSVTSGGFILGTSPNPNGTGGGAVQTSALQTVVTTDCVSPLPSQIVSGTQDQNPVYQTDAATSCTIQVQPPTTQASSANFTLTQADQTVLVSQPAVPLIKGVGVVQIPANLRIAGNAAYAKSTATNSQNGQTIQGLVDTITVGTVYLVVDSDNDTTIDPQTDSAAAIAGKKFSFWQKDPNNLGNGGEDALVDFAPLRIYAGALPDPTLGKIQLQLFSPNYTASFVLTRNQKVPDRTTDADAANKEKLYLSDADTAQTQATITNSNAVACGAASGNSFDSSLCGSVAGGVELNGLINGQMYDLLLSVTNITCSNSTCPADGSGTLKVVLVKNDGTTEVLDQVPVDMRPLQNWMTLETVRNGSANTPQSYPILESGWEDIPTAAQRLVVLVHGFKVSETDATTGFMPDWFKRLYWSGHPVLLAQNNAHTIGYLWPGDPGVTNYPVAYMNAFESGVPLASFLNDQAVIYNRKIQILAHSLGNVVVNSALSRTEIQLALNAGAITTYVMNEPALPAEAFDSNYQPSATENSIYDQHAVANGWSDNPALTPIDNIWQLQWSQATQLEILQWTGTLSSPSYVTSPQPQYALRWGQSRPAGGVLDSAAFNSTPQRGPWRGFFAGNLSKTKIINTFNTNDGTLLGVWRDTELLQEPDVGVLGLFSDNILTQFWSTLASTDGGQESLWAAPCTSLANCQHSNIIRQWAELAYWFPSRSGAAGSGPLTSMQSLDFTSYAPPIPPGCGAFPLSAICAGLGYTDPTHSYLELSPYPMVFKAWQQVSSALQ